MSTPELVSTSVALGTWSLSLQHVANPTLESTRKRQCDLWAFVWGSGVALAEMILHTAPSCVLRGKVIAELGAGIGIPSLTAAYACGATVVATDLVSDSLELLRLNAASAASTCSRECSGHITTAKLDWNASELPPDMVGRFDVVVGADVLYLASAVKPVLRTAAALCCHGGVVVLVDPGRPTTEDLPDIASELGLTLCFSSALDTVATSVAKMRKCSVFVLCKGGVPAVEDESDVLKQFRLSTVRLQELAAIGAASPGACQYTL
jgi:predicted nicotinamide N-methyase